MGKKQSGFIGMGGFTIAELMVALAIITILAAVAVPNLVVWRANQQLKGSAREVQAFINNARIDAIKNNTNVNVTIDDANRRVTSQFTNRFTGVTPPPSEILLKPGIDIQSTTVLNNVFTFNSRGIPTNFGTIVLNNNYGRSYSVIMSLTGDLRISI